MATSAGTKRKILIAATYDLANPRHQVAEAILRTGNVPVIIETLDTAKSYSSCSVRFRPTDDYRSEIWVTYRSQPHGSYRIACGGGQMYIIGRPENQNGDPDQIDHVHLPGVSEIRKARSAK